MSDRKPQFYFLLVLLAGILALAFFILRPFIYPLILAAVFAVVFQPLYKKALEFTRQRQGLAALFTIIIILTLVIAPLVFLGIQIFQEARQLYSTVTGGDGKDIILSVLNSLRDALQKLFPVPREFSIDLDQYLKQGLSWLLQNLSNIFSSFAKMIVSSFIFLVALYFLFKDGQKLKKTVVALSPLADTDDETVFKKLELAINSVIKGNLLIALIQGVSVSVGLAVFGVPNAVLWGSAATIAALIPGIGTALVWIPAVIFLFLNSKASFAVGLLTWGTIVGLIDNFLRPKLVERGMQLHPLIIFLSVFGGIGFFGPIGFLLGPLTMSLFFALLEIYTSLKSRKENDL